MLQPDYSSLAIDSLSPSLERVNPAADKSARIMSTLAWSVRCNIPMGQALLTLAELPCKKNCWWNIFHLWRKNSQWRRNIRRAANELENGMPLSAAIAHLQKYLPPYIPSAIGEAERKNRLPELLPILAEQMNYVADIHRHRISAFSYPVLQFLYCFSIASFIALLMVPKYQRFYTELYDNHPLPYLTYLLCNYGEVIPFMLIIPGTLFFYHLIFRFFYKNEPTARLFADFLLLPLPLIGKDMKRIALIELAGSMASFIKSGLDIITAAELSKETISSYWLRKKLGRFIQDTKNGKKWIDAWEEMNVGSHFYNWIARNAASQENVSEGFMQIMKWLKTETSQFSHIFIKTIEVLGVLFNAIFVGFIALALCGGIFEIIYIAIGHTQ